MTPTRYQAAPPRTVTLADECARVKSLMNLAPRALRLLKLLSELGELLFQINNLVLKARNFLFQLSHAASIECMLRSHRVRPWFQLCLHHVAKQKISVARFFHSRLTQK